MIRVHRGSVPSHYRKDNVIWRHWYEKAERDGNIHLIASELMLSEIVAHHENEARSKPLQPRFKYQGKYVIFDD